MNKNWGVSNQLVALDFKKKSEAIHIKLSFFIM